MSFYLLILSLYKDSLWPIAEEREKEGDKEKSQKKQNSL